MTVATVAEGLSVGGLGDIADVIMGQSPVGSSYNKDGSGAPLINGPTEFTDRYPFAKQWTTAPVRFCEPHDVLICVRGSSTGRMNRADSRYCIGRGVAAVRARGKNNQRFVRYALAAVVEQLLKLQTGSTFPSIDSRVIRSAEILIPTPSEQARIGEALNDSDDLIASLERLIAKKRAIKQGTMQELLTGRTRLAGFTEPWEEVRLGDIARIKTGSRNNQDKTSSGRFPFFVRSATVERIDSYSYDCEAILVPGEGGIGSIFHYINGKFEVHQRVYMISNFADNTSGRFIFYYMRQFFGVHAMANSVKATVDSLRLPTFKSFTLFMPSTLEEQRAITQVLSDADDEIDLLNRRLAKATAVKQGMMQELLAGRTRLPVKEHAL
jgi:type I restriction enzyme S subunit